MTMTSYTFTRYEVTSAMNLAIPDDEIVAWIAEAAGKIIVVTYKPAVV